MIPIAYVHNDLPSKFGAPRQSGFVPSLKGRIVFEPEYSAPEAFRGLDGFSHIWVLWEFSEIKRGEWSHTVRPPRLGGNKRVGVFASRSPFRPNNIGLSCLKLDKIRFEDGKAVLYVAGCDMIDNTPIFDIKPYIPAADLVENASEGYTAETKTHFLKVDFPPALMEKLPKEVAEAVTGILSLDPRPAYIDDNDRVYGVSYAGYDIRFTVNGEILTVTEVIEL